MSTLELMKIVYASLKEQAKNPNVYNYGVLGTLPKVVK